MGVMSWNISTRWNLSFKDNVQFIHSDLQKCSLHTYLTVMQCAVGKISKFVICWFRKYLQTIILFLGINLLLFVNLYDSLEFVCTYYIVTAKNIWLSKRRSVEYLWVVVYVLFTVVGDFMFEDGTETFDNYLHVLSPHRFRWFSNIL